MKRLSEGDVTTFPFLSIGLASNFTLYQCFVSALETFKTT
jgi:hypothetical protein